MTRILWKMIKDELLLPFIDLKTEYYDLGLEHRNETNDSRWHPFSRSYGVILPSSLTMLLPPALGFSPHPPVSVYGTGTHETIAAFLGTWLTRFATLIRSTSRLRIAWRICQPDSFSACTGISIPGSCSPHASPQFCSYVVQESKPVVHRIRLSTSP